MPKYEKVLVAGDWHIPFHDEKVNELFFKFAKHERPDWVILDGDLLDFWEISKYDRVPRYGKTFEEEIDIAKAFLKRLRKLLPNARITLIEGNHEFRLKSFIVKHAPQLYGVMPIEKLLDLKLYNIEFVQCKPGQARWDSVAVKVGALYVGHWNKVSKHGGYTAKLLLDDKGVNLIQGHTHRIGRHNRTLHDGTELVAIENGCMCDLNPSYMAHPNWQHGMCVVYHHVGGDTFYIYPIHIVDYHFFWQDREFFL